MTARRKIALLAALYVAQGLPFGFQAVALPAYLRERGVSLMSIGFLGLLSLPWGLKALLAPFVDRYGSARFGRRRSWIVPMQAGLALSCFAAALTPPDSRLGLLLALVFLMNLFAATQDIAVDGLAVDLLAGGRELGAGNAAQVVGYKVGMLTGGGLLVAASGVLGWSGLFLAMGGIVTAVLLVVLAVPEPTAAIPSPTRSSGRSSPEQAAAAPQRTLREIVGALAAALRLPGTGWLLAFVGTYKVGEAMVTAMFKPFLVDAGHTPQQIGLWLGTYGMLFSIGGSLLGGFVAARVPLGRALGAALLLRLLSLAAVCQAALPDQPATGVLIGIVCVEQVFSGLLTTVMFAFMMTRIDRRIGATHFTVLATVEYFGKSPGAWLAGPLAETLGYAPLFALGTIVSATLLPLALPLRRR